MSVSHAVACKVEVLRQVAIEVSQEPGDESHEGSPVSLGIHTFDILRIKPSPALQQAIGTFHGPPNPALIRNLENAPIRERSDLAVQRCMRNVRN